MKLIDVLVANKETIQHNLDTVSKRFDIVGFVQDQNGQIGLYTKELTASDFKRDPYCNNSGTWTIDGFARYVIGFVRRFNLADDYQTAFVTVEQFQQAALNKPTLLDILVANKDVVLAKLVHNTKYITQDKQGDINLYRLEPPVDGCDEYGVWTSVGFSHFVTISGVEIAVDCETRIISVEEFREAIAKQPDLLQLVTKVLTETATLSVADQARRLVEVLETRK